MPGVLARLALMSALVTTGALAQEGLYGRIEGTPRTDIKPAVNREAVPDEWQRADFYVISTELSPGTLTLCRDSRIRFFSGLPEWGLGSPTRAAVPTAETVRMMARGDVMLGEDQSEAWVLVWFDGAEGWTNWDAPWLLVLQHRPTAVTLDDDGIAFSFDGPCGYIASMPLYGFYKPPTPAGDVLANQGLPTKGVTTWTWYQGLPPEVLDRCRWWAQVLREFPLDCRETFSVDRSKDAVMIRQDMTWITVADDFGTEHRKFAPLSPSLGLAWLDGGYPMRVSADVTDPELFTPYGPYVGVEGVDRFEVRLDVLQYVHEMEAPQEPDVERDPSVAQALSWIQEHMAQRYSGDPGEFIWDHGSADNFCWQIMGDRWYAKALPYMDEATREKAKASLRHYFADYVLKEENYEPFRGMLLLKGPGISTWGGYDDAGKFSSNLLETLWCYADYTGDWDLIRERWPMILRLFITPLESQWKTFGRHSIAEMGDEASPPLCLARMAYKVGDIDTYLYASYVFARETVHHYIKSRGARYFREDQPVGSMEPMAEPVYLTNLWGDTAGWRIDGPTYPQETGERQYRNRWVRFTNEDVARFHRECLLDDMREELDWLLTQEDSAYKPGQETAHIAPSMEHLRSFLLNEAPEELATLTPADQRSPGRDADGIAYFHSFLRTSREPQFQRLIAKVGTPSPYVLGIQRSAEPDWPMLVQGLASVVGEGDDSQAAWPVPSWRPWPTPLEPERMPAAGRWPFGQIVPGDGAPPASVEQTDLSWVTQVTHWERQARPDGPEA